MIPPDVAGVALVYIYVAILLIVTEKFLDKYPEFSRKFLHIMVGNIAFLLPIFVTKEMMAFVAAAPFIPLTFLMSPHTPIKSLRGKTSAAGHGMGLVYYVITWTILAYLFFDNMVVIGVAIFAMSYGDGFASVIGLKFGKKKYNVCGDVKSYIGSLAMFAFTFIMSFVALLYYNIEITTFVMIVIFLLSVVAAVVEGITPKGLDNLTVPFACVLIYWYFMIL